MVVFGGWYLLCPSSPNKSQPSLTYFSPLQEKELHEAKAFLPKSKGGYNPKEK